MVVFIKTNLCLEGVIMNDILLSLNIIESELNDAVLQLPEGGTSDSLTSIDFARDELNKVIKKVENLNDFIG